MRDAESTDLRDTGVWDQWTYPTFTDSCPPIASKHLSKKRVLITGAAGSIGSALTNAVSAAHPASLVLLDTSESGLYHLDRHLQKIGSRGNTLILGSICDRDLLSHLFQQHRPQIVLHAAALKHVPLMERNPFAAIETNALGTLALAQATVTHAAEQLILVSTDKAVDPLSIMGAAKRIAELILLTLDANATRMTSVRLCNVIGSQGSVLPLFLEQIASGGPLTVTHPEASRYFLSLDSAVQAILAALHVQSSPALLIPGPGAPTRILHLAEHLLKTHKSPAAIEFTGLRPGDKISESLLSGRERRSASPADEASILYAIEGPAPSHALVLAVMSELRQAIQTRDLPRLLTAIHALVPEYQPSKLLEDAQTRDLLQDLTPGVPA